MMHMARGHRSEGVYDVCLSFAGEQRAFVEGVATRLRERQIRVFYDDFEKTRLWGKDLYEHLDYVYRQAASYCVVFVSADYARKVWTRHEGKSALARALDADTEYILPVRFDDTELPGLRPTIAYVDLRTTTSDELVEMIVEKVRPKPYGYGKASKHIDKGGSLPRTPSRAKWLKLSDRERKVFVGSSIILGTLSATTGLVSFYVRGGTAALLWSVGLLIAASLIFTGINRSIGRRVGLPLLSVVFGLIGTVIVAATIGGIAGYDLRPAARGLPNIPGRTSASASPSPLDAVATHHIAPHLVRTLGGRVAGIDVTYSPNGKMLVTANSYGGINLWNPATGVKTTAPLLEPYYDGSDQWTISVAYSPNGQTWAIAGDNNIVSVWNVATKRITVSLNVSKCDSPGIIAYSPDGTKLVTACNSSTAKTYLRDVTTGQTISVFDAPPGQSVVAVAYSPKGTTLVTADSNNNTGSASNASGNTYLWDVATGQIVATLSDPRSQGANDVAYSPNGKTIATADNNGDIYLWDAATGREIATLTTKCQGIYDVAYSPDGTTLATVCGYQGNNVNLWDIATGHVAAMLTDPGTDGVDAIAYSPDGGSLAVGDNNGNIYLWTHISL